MEKGLWDEAERVLTSILEDPVGDSYPLYNALTQERADKLLSEIRDR